MMIALILIFATIVVAQTPPYINSGYEVEAIGFGVSGIVNVTIQVERVSPILEANRFSLTSSFLNATNQLNTITYVSDPVSWNATWAWQNKPSSYEHCSWAHNRTGITLFDFSSTGWLSQAVPSTDPHTGNIKWVMQQSRTQVVDVPNLSAPGLRRSYGVSTLVTDANGNYLHLQTPYDMILFAEQPRVTTAPPKFPVVPNACPQKPSSCEKLPKKKKMTFYRNHGNATHLYVEINDVNMASPAGEAAWLCGRQPSLRSPLLTAFELTIDSRFDTYSMCNRGKCDMYYYGQQFGVGKQNNGGPADICKPWIDPGRNCSSYCGGGEWYSFPSTARCAPHQPLGSKKKPHYLGCSWLNEYTVKKSITVQCLHDVTNNFNCRGHTLTEMGQQILKAFTLCPDVQNTSWPPLNRKRSVAEDMELQADFEKNDDSGMPAQLSEEEHRRRAVPVQPGPVRWPFTAPQPSANVRIPFFAGNYTFNLTTSSAPNSLNYNINIVRSSNTAKPVMSMTWRQSSIILDDPAYKGVQTFPAQFPQGNIDKWRYCQYYYNVSSAESFDFGKSTSWLRHASVRTLNTQQVFFAHLEGSVGVTAYNIAPAYRNLTWVSLVTNQHGDPLIFVTGTVDQPLFNYFQAPPQRLSASAVANLTLTPPAACVQPPVRCRKANTTSVPITVYKLHNGTAAGMDVVSANLVTVDAVMGLYARSIILQQNYTYLSEFQLTIAAAVTDGVNCNRGVCSMHSYGQALGVGHTQYPSGSTCNFTAPTANEWAHRNCSYYGCPVYGQYYVIPTDVGACPPGVPIGTNNCTWSQSFSISKNITWDCIRKNSPTQLRFHNRAFGPLVNDLINGLQKCPNVPVVPT